MTEMNCLPDTVEQSAVDQVTVTSDQGQIQMQRRGANDAVGHVGHLLARNTAQCLDDRRIKRNCPMPTTGVNKLWPVAAASVSRNQAATIPCPSESRRMAWESDWPVATSRERICTASGSSLTRSETASQMSPISLIESSISILSGDAKVCQMSYWPIRCPMRLSRRFARRDSEGVRRT